MRILKPSYLAVCSVFLAFRCTLPRKCIRLQRHADNPSWNSTHTIVYMYTRLVYGIPMGSVVFFTVQSENREAENL